MASFQARERQKKRFVKKKGFVRNFGRKTLRRKQIQKEELRFNVKI